MSASAVLSTFPKPTTDLSNVCQVLSPLQYCVVVPAAIIGSFVRSPGTLGKSAVPLKSPANFILPFIVEVASGVALLATNVSTAATLGYNVVEPVFEAIFEVKFAVVCAPVTSATGIEVTAVIGLTPLPLTYPVKVDAPVPPLVTVITSPILAFVTAPFAILFVTIPKSFTLKGLAVVPVPSIVI